MSIERDRVFGTPLEGLVGGFGRPDASNKLEALAHMDPLSIGILVGEIRRDPLSCRIQTRDLGAVGKDLLQP